MAIRSGVLALRRGGIVWRDTFYPTATLRDHQRLEWPATSASAKRSATRRSTPLNNTPYAGGPAHA